MILTAVVKHMAAISLAMLPLSSPASSVDRPIKPVDCDKLAKGMLKGGLTPQSEVKAVGDSCIFTYLLVRLGSERSRWSIERLTLTGSDLRVNHDYLPPSLKAEAKGIRFDPPIDSSHVRYLIAVQQRPFDVRFDYGWDKSNGELHLREIALQSPWGGYASLGMRIHLPGGLVPDNVVIEDIGISEVRLRLDNDGLLEGMGLPALIGMIPYEKDPAVEFPRIQRSAERKIRSLPASFTNQAGQDALIRFIRDFPHPSGRFEATIRFDRPLKLEEAKGQKGEDALRQAHMEARYEPSPRPAPE